MINVDNVIGSIGYAVTASLCFLLNSKISGQVTVFPSLMGACYCAITINLSASEAFYNIGPPEMLCRNLSMALVLAISVLGIDNIINM